MGGLRVAMAIGCVLALPGMAAAQVCRDKDPDAPPPSSAELAESARLNTAAEAAFRGGDLARAEELLTAALALNRSSPTLLYNLGKTFEKQGKVAAAVDCLTAYLALENTVIDGRDGLFAHVQALRRQLEASPPTSLRRRPRPEPSIGPWVVIGIGAASLASGAGFAYLVDHNGKLADDPMTTQAEASAAYDRAQRYQTLETVTLIGGAVAVAGGLTWLLIDGRATRAAQRQWQLDAGPQRVALRIAF